MLREIAIRRSHLRWPPARPPAVQPHRAADAPVPELGLQGGQLVVHLRRGRHLVELLLDVVDRLGQVVERARSQQLVERPGARLHAGDLVLGPLHGRPGVARGVRDARHGLAHLGLGLGGGVGGLERLLLGAEALDPGLQLLGGLDELLLLLADLVVLRLELGQLLAERGPARQRLAGEVLVALLQRGLGLALQLVGLLLQPLGLQLDPLAGRGDVGHPPPDLLQLLELLLVGEVQRVARVLHLVQGLVRLGPEDVTDATPRACHGYRA